MSSICGMVSVARGLNLTRLYALCHVDHRASSRVLEKTGFVQEGVLRRYLEFPNLSTDGPSDVFCSSVILPNDSVMSSSI